jgi:molecular chaperone Hsp33
MMPGCEVTHVSDYMLRIISKQAGVRGLACVTTELVTEAARRHQTVPVATAVLGYGLTAGALLGGLLKVQQRVALRVSGSGPIKKLAVESDSYGRVRGYVTPVDVWSPLPIGREEVRAAVGDRGLLSVVKDLRVKDLYEGVVPLQSGLLDVDLTYSLMMSEQTPSVVEIGVELDRVGQITIAGGLLLQTLPGQDVSILRLLVERLDDLPPLGEVLAGGETLQQVIAALFADTEYEILETYPLEFRCSCSRERSKMALNLLDRSDWQALRSEGEAVVECHFCHERYVFDGAELESLSALPFD